MATFGYTLFSEMHDPRRLVDLAVAAEEAGFDFVSISDHYHPWLDSHGHAPFAWSVLGAVARETERVELTTMVTCPFVRYHPALVAQAAGTVGVLSEGRFTLGLGTGERLNEHVVGQGWPPVDVRHEMLRESVEAIRELWAGGFVTYRGDHITVEDARVFDVPDPVPDVFIGVSGDASVDVATELEIGICAVEPDGSLVERYVGNDGDRTRTWGQVPLAWDSDEEKARQLAHERFKFGAAGWKVMAELPNIVNFEAASETVRVDDVAESVSAGPDPKAHVEGIQAYLDAGYEHVAVIDLGDEAEGFLAAWQQEIRPELV